MSLSPEVLIYIQTLKHYFENNQESRDYFLGGGIDGEEFFFLVGEVSQKNFEKTGEPQLSKEQFEFLKLTLRAFKMSEEPDENFIYEYKTEKINFILK